jgi:tetratricopeptide (TPR) repeat protein
MRLSIKTLCAWLPVVLLAACAQAPKRPDATVQVGSEPPPPAALGQEHEEDSHLPNVELTPGLLYELIAAEIANQHGATLIAYSKFMELAERTRDPRLARRAAQIANDDRDQDKILRASTLWVELDPDNVDARLALAQSLLAAGRGEEAAPHLEKLLASGGVNVTEVFLNINGLLARNPDRKTTLTIVQRLAAKYPSLPEARFAVARAAMAAGEDDLAVSEARAATRLKPAWDSPVRLAAQVLSKRSAAEASAELKRYLDAHPAASEVRQDYARSLFAEKKTAEAREQFQRVEADAPGNPDVLFALGRLSLDAHDYAGAETYLKKLLAADPRDSNLAYLYLGQAAEEQKKYAAARDWWKQIGQGEQYFAAQSLIAQSLAKEGKLDEGRAYLQAVVTTNNQQRVQMILAEAQLLRDANLNREAFDLIEKALDKLPNHPDLLYESAMTAEKLSRLDVQESQLKKLIQLKPDYAQAYNALGYSLADRNERLTEAKDLIEKALKIAPDDAAIIDSMGWVLYRLGDLVRAEELLKRAYEAQPDPEIAAHLGEVLWKANKHAEAERVWRGALAKAPDDETLKSTMKRLDPK